MASSFLEGAAVQLLSIFQTGFYEPSCQIKRHKWPTCWFSSGFKCGGADAVPLYELEAPRLD